MFLIQTVKSPSVQVTQVFRRWFYTCFYLDGSRHTKAVQAFEEEEEEVALQTRG